MYETILAEKYNVSYPTALLMTLSIHYKLDRQTYSSERPFSIDKQFLLFKYGAHVFAGATYICC